MNYMVKSDIKYAVKSLRTAFKTCLDEENFNENDLSEIWRHYLGMKTILKKLPEDNLTVTEYSFNANTTSSGYDPDSNINFQYGAAAADTISFADRYGQDVVTFS